MAINYTYPEKAQAIPDDEVLIIDSTDKITRRTSIKSILALGTGGGSGGVTTFQATNGTFINFTPNTATLGSITLTGDLSAPNPSSTTFLRGDNTWSTAITNVIGLDPISVSVASGVATVSIGTFVSVADGGTGLTALGTRSQLLAVNSTATALEYIDPAIVETVRASETILQGDPLYITGEVGGITTVGRAQSGDANKMPCVGIARTEITINTDGDMYVIGVLDGLPMNTLLPDASENDVVYVAPTGGLTLIKPTGTNLIQNIGIVTKPTGTGSIQVTAIGRSNGLPNVPQGNIWLGDSNSAPVALPIGGAGTVLTSNGTTASWSTTGVTNYLPLAGGTMTGSINNVSLVQLLEQALPNATVSNTPTFDAANGAYANIFADGPITTFTITVMPNGTTSKLFITTSASASVGTWVDSNSANVIWAGGSAPTLNTNGAVDVITFEFSQGIVYASIIQGYA